MVRPPIGEHASGVIPEPAKVVDEAAHYLGLACVNLCRLLDPQMVVFAGGMALAGDLLFERVRKVFKHHYWTLQKPHLKIVPAELGNDAGLIGAAAVARAAGV